MSNTRIPWDQYFMAQAVLLSLRSTCSRLEVGATLVNDYRNNQYALELIQQVDASVHQVELDPVYFEKLSFGVLNDAQPTKEN